jgi:hypothetical protein
VPMLLAYFGPETVLPATSALAALAGFALMFGGQAIRMAGLFVRWAVRAIPRPARRAPAIPTPHLPGFRRAGRVVETAAPRASRADS